jgi:hypothetical protein
MTSTSVYLAPPKMERPAPKRLLSLQQPSSRPHPYPISSSPLSSPGMGGGGGGGVLGGGGPPKRPGAPRRSHSFCGNGARPMRSRRHRLARTSPRTRSTSSLPRLSGHCPRSDRAGTSPHSRSRCRGPFRLHPSRRSRLLRRPGCLPYLHLPRLIKRESRLET